jgi:hypothetical protein
MTPLRRLVLLLPALLVAGCATVPLQSARRDFNAGRLAEADRALSDIPADKDQVLYLMERGMIRHVRGDFKGSLADWLDAVRVEQQLETHSASKAATSMVVNDSSLAFRGYPYERTYLRVFLARNFLALSQWDDAAVEARNIVRAHEQRGGYPDDAYSHYVAGFCFELIGDDNGASLEYKAAAKLAGDAKIDATTGRFADAPRNDNAALPCELVCFIDIQGNDGPMPDTATIIQDGRVLGTAHVLATVPQLETASEQQHAARKAAKAVSRIALKASIAEVVEHQNKALGDLTRLLLFALESPDTRRWETLPGRLAIARVPCPADLKGFEVVYRNPWRTERRVPVPGPLSRRDRIFFAICRDAP